MPIFIYNSLSRKKEELLPLKPKEIKMYACGPTVYDQPHIGHARSAYIFDVIRRYLTYRGYKVKFVRNVTDVDDKIIDKARKEFQGEDLNIAVGKVSTKYLDFYHEDMKSLGILEPDVEPKATEYVSQENPLMQKFIEQLIKNGCAYVSEGDVYFDIRKAKDYGKLSKQVIEKMELGARIALGEKKKDPLDFALWKSAKAGEPAWDSPWGRGRPGWHIECSVMSSDILGDEFDIHGGGIDLIFPHHENELAQSEAAGKKFAHYWMHHGLLTINSQKMSKSLGNFITIKDFIAKYHNSELLKFFFLFAHYAHPVDYTDEKIQEAKQALERIAILKGKMDRSVPLNDKQSILKQFDEIDNIRNKFIEVMDDDFNTPQALASIFDLVTLINEHINDADFIKSGRKVLSESLDILGISFENILRIFKMTFLDEVSLKEEVEIEIEKRREARKNKDFALSDKIRKELEAKGIILEDSKDVTTWRKKL
ncbi:MAG: cysteine--tRNA ligase [Candidatus Omnitrophota bacterium]|nr:cysteine--tRNA ligase [Candidatus Omnitrophota bacterium]